ncbi:MAG: hypothetical protein O7C75_19410 [Verrucomicrobia bacterium]|nr:hypothetical protein [Verrucomicrobiota bacterium]
MSWTSEFRLLWVIRLIGVGLVAGMLLSWKAWISDRQYPMFPVWDWVPQFPSPLDTVFVVLFFFVVGWMCYKPNRNNVIGVVVVMLVFALQDQSRWQPWFYQYGLMLIPFVFLKKPGKEFSVLGLQQLLIALVYIWGGIHKCQPGWISVWENSLIAPILDGLENEGLKSFLGSTGYLIPLVEIVMAIGLLFRPTRLIAILAVISTHITILILLGPVKGYISNSVVWPWNMVMIGMVVVLYYKAGRTSLAAFRKKHLLFPAWGIAFLMTIAPILFYADLWDRYLSFSLYAGQQKRYLVRVDAAAIERFPVEWEDYFADPKANDGHMVLSPGHWSTEELNVPLISEWRILRAFSRKLCNYDTGDSRLVFYVDHRHLPKKGKRYFSCDQIEEMR